MASSPSPVKRRRLSPTSTTPFGEPPSTINAPTIPDDLPSEVLFQPRNGLRRTPPLPSRPSQDRASFLSPTKSSLARYNPGLLSPDRLRRASSLGTGGSTRRARQETRSSSVLPPDPSIDGPGEEEGIVPDYPAVEDVEAGTPEGPPPLSPGGRLALRPRSSTVARATPRLSAGVGGAFLASSPARRGRSPSKTPARRVSNVETPPAVDDPSVPDDEAEETPDARRRSPRLSRQSPLPSDSQDAEQEQDDETNELDLPPTPTQLGLADPVMSRPPAGLANSPGRRGKRKRKYPGSFDGEATKSSPLRKAQRARRSLSHEEPEAAGEREKDGRLLSKEERADARALRDKRKIRDELLAELQTLQHDVSRQEKILLRIQGKEEGGGIDESMTADDLPSLLLTPSTTAIPAPSAETPLATLITSFLPFSYPSKSPIPLQSSTSTPFPSHHPLPLSNPLPHLQVFTPLTLTSTTTLSFPSSSSNSPIETHIIQATTPSNLLTATLVLTVSPLPTPTILSLTLPYLSPWANPELGVFLRAHVLSPLSPLSPSVSGPGPPLATTVRHDPTLALTLLGRYYTLALHRARLFAQLCRLYPSFLQRSQAAASDANPKRTEPSVPLSQAAGSERKQILAFLGQSSLLFSRDGMSLLLRHALRPTPAGDVVAEVGVTAGQWPGAYTSADERGSLGRVAEGVGGVVAGCAAVGGVGGGARGVREGVRVVVGLVFGVQEEGEEEGEEEEEEEEGEEGE